MFCQDLEAASVQLKEQQSKVPYTFFGNNELFTGRKHLHVTDTKLLLLTCYSIVCKTLFSPHTT